MSQGGVVWGREGASQSLGRRGGSNERRIVREELEGEEGLGTVIGM